MIAFMLGADSVADFIVSMAGPGIKGDSLLAEQQNAQLRLYGKPANRTVKQVREEMKLQPKNVRHYEYHCACNGYQRHP